MRVVVNGSVHTFAEVIDVAELVRLLGHDPDQPGTAVACNGDVVPRAQWRVTPIADGDAIEVVRAAAGG